MHRLWKVLVVCLLWMGGLTGCSAPIKPYTDAVFRLRTEMKPQGCTDPTKQLCRWKLIGKIAILGVVPAGDNPFSDCSNCAFNQKIAIEDNQGSLHYIYYGLPTEDNAALEVGTPVELLYIEGAVVGQGYALSLRHRDGSLLLAMSTGPGGTLLKAAELGNMKVTINENENIGQETNECGTKNYRLLQFSITGASVELAPGKSQILNGEKFSYKVANINRFNWSNSRCANLGATPFAYYIIQNKK